ncbi:MAG: glycosyltransferase family 4 protein [Erythrobacter sp.]
MNAESNSVVPRILHCHSTFSAGGKELRSVHLMNAFGAKLKHSIVSGEPGQMAASPLIAKGVAVDFPQDFPKLQGFPSPGRLLAIARAIQSYDLVLTYNWGAMDVVMARTAFSGAFNLPPLIHHEDGFNEDEAQKLKRRRNWYRMIALGQAAGLIVPSRQLEQIALETWELPTDRVMRIPNGIDTLAFAKKPKPDALRVVKHKGEQWVGTLAGLRPVKQLPLLVRAFAQLPKNWQLVILGEGPDEEAIREAADALEISHRVHLPGAVQNPAAAIGLFDIFALSSKSEQFPLSVAEAMAAGLPVAAPDVGDVRHMVAEENRPFIATPDSASALAHMLEELAGNPELRQEIGEANRKKAIAQFDAERMIARYRDIYSSALDREF